jgi:hypothetical protein
MIHYRAGTPGAASLYAVWVLIDGACLNATWAGPIRRAGALPEKMLLESAHPYLTKGKP